MGKYSEYKGVSKARNTKTIKTITDEYIRTNKGNERKRNPDTNHRDRGWLAR